MPELDPFDARLTAAVRAFADSAETGVDAMAVAERTIRRRPRGAFAWLAAPLPVPAWLILAAGLLAAALLGATMIGGAWRDDPTSVVPAPSPSPLTSTIPSLTAPAIAEVDLANVRARTLPAAATCPVGTDPNAPGPLGGTWPPAGTTAMAFDRQSGAIVALVTFPPDRAETWTFDVCVNTWMRRANGPALVLPVLVYDADSDRTIALSTGSLDQAPDTVETWSYDLEEDRWRQGAASPVLSLLDDAAEGTPASRGFAATYHDPSGLVVAYDGTRSWAYDVEVDAWSAVPWQDDWVRPSGANPVTAAYDPVRDRFVLNVEGATLAEIYGDNGRETMTLVPATGRVDSVRPGLGFMCGWVSEWCATVFDQPTGRTIWTDGGTHVEAWDPAADDYGAWETLHYVSGEQAAVSPAWCETSPPAADTLNGRIVCRGAAGSVAAFTPSTRHWQWLLEPRE